jgi:hypothetical protein
VKRRFVTLGIVLACGGAILMSGRNWQTTPEQAAHSGDATETQRVAGESDEAQSAGADHISPTIAASGSSPAATTGIFRGRIIDAVTRQPISQEVEVRLLRIQEGPEYREEPPITRTFQAKDGRFVWQDAPAGNWHVTVAARGYQLFQFSGFGIDAEKKTREIVMPLRSGYTVRGRVFEQRSGAAIAEADIYASRSGVGSEEGQSAQAKSNADGTFVLDGVPGGDVNLAVGKRGHFVYRELEIVVDESVPPQEIGLSRGGRIAGVIETATGMPIKGHVMMIRPDRGGFYAAEAKDSGEFAFEQLSPGRYEVSAMTGAGSTKLQVELAHEERKEGLVLTLDQGRSIRGVVRGLSPEQLREVSINVRPPTKSLVSFIGKPDEQGAYSVNGVPPGRMQLSAYGKDVRPVFRLLDVPADKDVSLDIVFTQGLQLSGRVMQDGKPVAHTIVTIEKDGLSDAAITQADGRYSIVGIAAGEYRIRADDDVKRTVVVNHDTVFNIEIPSVLLGGLVIEDGSAAPLVGASVSIRGIEPATAAVRSDKVTDHFGRFRLTGLERGDILFCVFKPGYEMYRERIVYDSPVKNKTISLRKSGGIEVRARTANGEPQRTINVLESIPGNDREINLHIPLDRDGVGFLPSALAGSTLSIYGATQRPVVIRQWDGQSLDLKF